MRSVLSLEIIGGKVAELAFSQLVDHFVGSIESQIATVLSAIQDLNDKMDRQLLIPLQSGLTYVQLEKWDDALREFIHANAAEPFSPVAKLWLALALWRLEKPAEAIRFFNQSLRINPFLLPKLIQSGVRPGLAEGHTVTWKRPLVSEDVLAQLPAKPIELFNPFQRRAATAIRRVSTSGANFVVRWVFGGELRDSAEQFIIALHKDTGDPLWTLECRGWSLAFATPELVFLYSDSDPQEFRIVDGKSGKILRTIGELFFRSYFVPAWATLKSDNLFNRDLWSLDQAYEKTTGKKLNWFRQLGGFTHEEKDVRETDLIPVFQDIDSLLEIQNAWTHAHVSYGQYGTYCGLWGQATISLLKTNVELHVVANGKASGGRDAGDLCSGSV